MKTRIVTALFVMCAAPFLATAQVTGATGVGTQITSDGSVGVIYRGGSFEGGISVQAILHDYSAEDSATDDLLRPGMHASYLFGAPLSPRRFGIGAQIATGLGMGDVEWDEYLDFGPRISLDQMIGARSYVSALVYPVWVATREYADVENSWTLTASVPLGRLAVTFLF